MAGPRDEAVELVDALAHSAFEVMGVLNRIGAAHDVSLTQLRVLGILRDRRLRMSDLADHLGLERSTMSGLVDRAEQRGLLRRERNGDDARAVDVVMTPAGLELANRVHAQIREALAPMTERLAERDRQRLTSLLEAMLA